ncbi:hypothetical protein DFH09DRAFT_1082296 [Mycena vulgaris]|nr:hypothetical protein DFH09DRAFT_1082296 [Mycena vulgaris]
MPQTYPPFRSDNGSTRSTNGARNGTAAACRLNAGSARHTAHALTAVATGYPPGSLHSVKYGIGHAIIQPLPVRLGIIPVAISAYNSQEGPSLNSSSSDAIPVEVEQASHFARRDAELLPNLDDGPQTTLPVVPGWIRAELASTVPGCRRRAMRDDVQQLQVQLEHLFGDRCLGGEDRATGDGVGLPLFDFDLDLNQSDGRTAWKMRVYNPDSHSEYISLNWPQRRLLAVYLPLNNGGKVVHLQTRHDRDCTYSSRFWLRPKPEDTHLQIGLKLIALATDYLFHPDSKKIHISKIRLVATLLPPHERWEFMAQAHKAGGSKFWRQPPTDLPPSGIADLGNHETQDATRHDSGSKQRVMPYGFGVACLKYYFHLP